MNANSDLEIRLIPVKQIVVLNPRDRSKSKFSQIVSNISKLGLKRPITVAQIETSNDQEKFNLVCGQGRLEAYIALKEDLIPARIIQGTKEDLLLMSLAENIARRQRSPMELVREIGTLKARGYSYKDIATKTDLAVSYVHAILQLLAKGEERLLRAVENGLIPVTIAITIATSDDKGIQRALMESYEKNDLRGKALLQARRLIESRKTFGKRTHNGRPPTTHSPVSTDDILKTYQKETFRQKLTVQRAKVSETRLLFATSAIKQLFQDENFITLLRAEGLSSLPQYLAAQIMG